MNIFDKLERRWGWISFPGFLRYYALLHVLVFALQIFRPDIGELLEFNRSKIFAGEVWRVVTMFFANSQFGRISPITLIFLFFVLNFVFMVSDALEGAWGAFKASLFYYAGMFSILVMNFVYPIVIPGSGSYLYGAAFLAFATLFPRVQILLMLIIPIQVKYLGMLAAGFLVLSVIRNPILLPFVLAAHLNYIFWVGIPALRGTARVIEASQRRKRFANAKGADSEAFHTCAVCGKTDVTSPHEEFRIGQDGQEYCSDHLPE